MNAIHIFYNVASNFITIWHELFIKGTYLMCLSIFIRIIFSSLNYFTMLISYYVTVQESNIYSITNRYIIYLFLKTVDYFL
jgi:hypothetical protein